MVQGHWVTAEKQLLVPRLGWCQSPFLSLSFSNSNSQSFFSLFPGLGTAEFPPQHHHTFGEVFFPTCSAQGCCLVRVPWSLPGARSCAGTSPSTLPTTLVGQTNSPGTHPCRTGSSARLKGPQGNFGGEFKLCCKGEDRPERFLLRQGQAQRRRLELMDSAITEMLGEALGRLLFSDQPGLSPHPHSHPDTAHKNTALQSPSRASGCTESPQP